MKHRIALKLINDEKKKTIVFSAKACTIDNADCAPGEIDVCLTLDIAGCYGNSSYDYCKYVDAALCIAGSFDYCNYDYQACHNGSNDICAIDN